MNILKRIRLYLWKNKLPMGTTLCLDTTIIEGIDNLILGEYVSIGPNATIYCTKSKIFIKNKVVIGPGLTIIAGDHNFKTIGKFIIDEYDKLPENDKDVKIESDCWIGANVTILKGVIIERGCVVAACSCVTKSFPPYSIIGGIPARIIGKRFNNDDIKIHEEIIYKIL